MRISKRRARLLVVCLAVLVIVLVVTVPMLIQYEEPYHEPYPPTEAELQTAVLNATSYLDTCTEPYTLLWLDMMYRRFGVTEFADSLQKYDQFLVDHPMTWSLLHIFRRMADYSNTPESEEFSLVQIAVDTITVPALYCDRMELPGNYSGMLEGAVDEGGYMLTHALLALVWMEENGCELELPEGFTERVYSDAASLINDDMEVSDLELEAAAFLYLAGQNDRVNSTFVWRIVELQNEDGSWGESDVDGHTTSLGLLILLHEEYPSESYPPTLATETS